jgi:hypothetical protein
MGVKGVTKKLKTYNIKNKTESTHLMDLWVKKL